MTLEQSNPRFMSESSIHFHIITLFPDMFSPMLAQGVLSRAISKDLIKISLHDLRDYTTDRHRQVDDYPFGGGPGMLLKPEPVFAAVASIKEQIGTNDTPTILISPQGKTFSHGKAKELSESRHIIVICGRYEGFDERIREYLATEEISLGDFIVSGGEIPAMLLIDSISRLVPTVVGSADSIENDSFYNGLLQYPQYTRPSSFHDMEVPHILLSGNHEEVRKWREIKSLEKTHSKRPDLLHHVELTHEQKRIVDSFERDDEMTS